MTHRTETLVWGLFYRKRLVHIDGRLPVFWLRKVADLYNRMQLNGRGVVKPIILNAREPQDAGKH